MTLWDAGEFLSAIHSVGIPHPPGTPLYVLIGAAWSRLLGSALGFARSINLLSAVATAAGSAILALCVSRWVASRVAGIAAGIAAGTMLSVWRSANETEVYALSFLLAMIALALGDRAGRSGRARDAVLAIYALALAIPLHLSALVVAPGVVLFAATSRQGRVRWPLALVLGGAALLAMALGMMAPFPAAVALLLMLVGVVLRDEAQRRSRLAWAVALGAVVLLGASAVAAMYFRAQYDPFVNQGNPRSIDGVLAVIGREQYDVAGVWPRRAPIWLQIGNLIQYADWQVAFGLDDWVGASLRRTPATLAFVVLAVLGAAWHRRQDPRSFRAFAVALVSASLGTVLVLNLRAGPSFGFGILPPDAAHEARERDYFFALAFALAGAWAGVGAARAGMWAAATWRASGAAPAIALGLAAAPLALNWRAADRARDDPPLAERFAAALLDAAPRHAVLFVAGDNDTYPLWFLQQVAGRRRDVTVVTIPLLPAEWYRRELQRRHGLLSEPAAWRGVDATVARVAERARQRDMPLTVAVSVPARQREALGGTWLARGMLFVRHEVDAPPPGSLLVDALVDSVHVSNAPRQPLYVDTAAVSRSAQLDIPARERDATSAYVAALLSCPAQLRRAVDAGGGSVDPRCNLR